MVVDQRGDLSYPILVCLCEEPCGGFVGHLEVRKRGKDNIGMKLKKFNIDTTSIGGTGTTWRNSILAGNA